MPPTLLQTSQETSKSADGGLGGREDAGMGGFGILLPDSSPINRRDRTQAAYACNPASGRDILGADLARMESFRGRHEARAIPEGEGGADLGSRMSHERALLAAILVVALLLRVVWVLQMRSNPYFEDP